MPGDAASIGNWRGYDSFKKADLIKKLKVAHDSSNDNFTSILIRLMHKADIGNFTKLEYEYEEEAAVVAAWTLGEIKPDYTFEEE